MDRRFIDELLTWLRTFPPPQSISEVSLGVFACCLRAREKETKKERERKWNEWNVIRKSTFYLIEWFGMLSDWPVDGLMWALFSRLDCFCEIDSKSHHSFVSFPTNQHIPINRSQVPMEIAMWSTPNRIINGNLPRASWLRTRAIFFHPFSQVFFVVCGSDRSNRFSRIRTSHSSCHNGNEIAKSSIKQRAECIKRKSIIH